MEKNRSKPEELSKNSGMESFPVVGIGASAGGLEALEQFFEQVPEDSGISYVVIQHLDPKQKGILPELLQRVSRLHVFRVEDGMKIQPNCIYVIPANKNMSILKDRLHLFEPTEKRGLQLPIDFFFRSLAEDRQEASIGIILSGMGSDGSQGLRAIKEKSGILLVQDPLDAKFDGMPRSAMENLTVDIVAAAAELPARLITLLHPKTIYVPDQENKYHSGLEKIIILLRQRSGNDFSLYKKNTVYRRIERRMGIHNIDEVPAYVRLLQNNPEEADILFKELLIGVTSFFRDPAVWEELKNTVFSNIFAGTPPDSALRAWVAGCSTGEEAYSLAITFIEAMEKNGLAGRLSLQIFATDLDKDAIEAARKGLFPLSIEADVSAERLNRFFMKVSNKYQVKTAIREMIVFAPHNLIMDPPFTNLDFISCRNLLIYLQTELQNKLLSLFHYCLNPDGILTLGKAESLGVQHTLFDVVDSRLKIFQASAAVSPKLIDFPISFSLKKAANLTKSVPVKQIENIQALTDQALLRQFSPAGILVNENGDIIYTSGRTGKYLEPAVGKANLNIFAMTRHGLQPEFSAAFRKALKEKEKTVIRETKVITNGDEQAVEVHIQWLEGPKPLKGLILIVFKDLPGTIRKGKPLEIGKEAPSELEIQLEKEVKHLKEMLENIRKEMQVSQEDLQSTNEELQSANEELQSANEELTTSKEEMQSMNEELQSVNAELQSKMSDYLKVNTEMKNLLKSTDIATLFLDKKLNIRNYTVQATEIFKLRQSDIGLPFTDQISDLDYPELAEDSKEVLDSLIPIEKQIPTYNGRWFTVRIIPFRTFDDRIDGLVITFINISAQKRMELKLIETEKILRVLLNSSSNAVVGLTSQWKILEINPAAETFFGTRREEALNCNFFELFIPNEAQKQAENDMEKLLKNEHQGISFETKVKAAGGVFRQVELSANPILDEDGKQSSVIIIVKNIPKP